MLHLYQRKGMIKRENRTSWILSALNNRSCMCTGKRRARIKHKTKCNLLSITDSTNKTLYPVAMLLQGAIYRIVENFIGANSRKNTTRRSRRNFCGFYFHAKLRGEKTPTQAPRRTARPLVTSLSHPFKHSRFLVLL